MAARARVPGDAGQRVEQPVDEAGDGVGRVAPPGSRGRRRRWIGRLVGPQVRPAVDPGLQDREVGLRMRHAGRRHLLSSSSSGRAGELVGEVLLGKSTRRRCVRSKRAPAGSVWTTTPDTSSGAPSSASGASLTAPTRRRRRRSRCRTTSSRCPPRTTAAVSSSTPSPSRPRGARHQREQPAVAVPLREVLVDDHVRAAGRARRPTRSCPAAGVSASSPKAIMCSLTALAPAEVPPTRAPRCVRRAHRVAEPGAGDDLGELELVAAGHEDGVDVVERAASAGSSASSGTRVAAAHVARHPASRNTSSYAVEDLLAQRGRGRHDGDPRAVAAGQPDELAQHHPRAGAVLGAADDAQGSGRDGADGSPGHGCERRGRGGAGHDVGMDSAPRLLVIVRHAKAESGEEGSDHDRRLTDRGLSGLRRGRPLAGRAGGPGRPRLGVVGPPGPADLGGRPGVAARGGRGGRGAGPLPGRPARGGRARRRHRRAVQLVVGHNPDHRAGGHDA